MESNYFKKQRNSSDPFVRNLFAELENRFKIFNQQNEVTASRMKLNDAVFAIIIMAVIAIYFFLIILS
jgi:hypothetical protein